MITTQTKPTTSIYHDTRKAKNSDQYPVKLRITFNRTTKYYSTNIKLTREQFIGAYLDAKPKISFKELSIRLRAIQSKAETIIDDMPYFSFEDFERMYFGARRKRNSILDLFEEYMEKLTSEGSIKTAETYGVSKRSLLLFLKDKYSGKQDIVFSDIKPDLFHKYENWMVKEKGKSLNTVGIYLRCVRCILNWAIDRGDLPREFYPFGKRKYKIPASKNVKRALRKEDLSKLYHFDASEDPWIEKARDFWFFSYQCNGINIRDIVTLRNENLTEHSIVFYRNKTKRTLKHNLKPIVVARTTLINSVIEKYGRKTAKGYIFDVLEEGMTEAEIIPATQNFTRFINQHMKRLAKKVGVTENISTYWARHSYATNAIRAGASMEYISESLGHSDLKTTQNYWSGFEENVKREFAEQLMNF